RAPGLPPPMLLHPLRAELPGGHGAGGVRWLTRRLSVLPRIVDPELRQHLPAAGVDALEDAGLDPHHRLRPSRAFPHGLLRLRRHRRVPPFGVEGAAVTSSRSSRDMGSVTRTWPRSQRLTVSLWT